MLSESIWSKLIRTATTLTLIVLGGTAVALGQAAKPSGPIVIKHQDGTVIEGLKITSTTGDCVRIINSTNITVQNSEIGPCAGNGVKIGGGDGISIFDSYIHPETLSPGCCDHNDGIVAAGTSNLVIQGNVIAYGESNIEVADGSNVTVTGNFLLNPRNEGVDTEPRGANFQCWRLGRTGTGCSNVTVENNYVLSSDDTTKYKYAEATADSISWGRSDGVVVQNNYVTGGHSPIGCAINADIGGDTVQFRNNIVVDAGQCGIAIHDGTNQLVDGNKVIIRNPVAGGGNQAMIVSTVHNTTAVCGPVTVSNNIAVVYEPNGRLSGFYEGRGCNPLIQANNVFGQPAVSLLTPVDQILPPPLIPPQPRNCVVTSPYSTQTAWPPCAP